MTVAATLNASRTVTPFRVLARRACLLLVASGVFGQPLKTQSEEDRTAEMKRRDRNSPTPGRRHRGRCGLRRRPLHDSAGAFARTIRKGFAVDINDTELFKLKQHLAEEGLKNVEIIKGEEDDPRLPADALNGALIVNAYHEMSAHEAMLRHVRAALKQGAVLVVMEGIWDKDEAKPRNEQIKHHELAPQMAREEVEKAGFKIVEVHDPFIERPPDQDGKSRWWILVARKPLH